MATLAHPFLACSSNSGRDNVNGCKIDPCCIETCEQVYRQRCSCLFSRFPHRDVANNWFLLCRQWCFSIKVHMEKCDEGAIMETAIKWYFSNAIFFFFSENAAAQGYFKTQNYPRQEWAESNYG